MAEAATMTGDDLVSIESVLGVVLPQVYRVLMPAYLPDLTTINSQIALLPDTPSIIAFNMFLREQFPGEWLPSYFAFGNSACGDPYFFDTGSGSAAVWLWDHETHEVVREAEDFSSWFDVQRS